MNADIVQCSGAQDITWRSHQMPRDAAILYPRTKPSSHADPPSYSGLLVMRDGGRYWASIWRREVKGRTCVELRLRPAEGGVR